MKKWLTVFGVIVLWLLPGCAAYMIQHPEKYTPEQIQAYKDVGADVYLCTAVSGPAVSGGFIMIIMPKGTTPTLSFAGNCQLLKAELNVK